MSSSSVAFRNEQKAQLGIRKKSRLIPVLLFVLTVVLFVVLALPSGIKQLGLALGLIQSINEPLDVQTIQEQLQQPGALEKLWSEIPSKNWTAWEYAENIGRPIFKIFLDQLGKDFVQIIKATFATAWQLSLFALIPGIAGLIYRRDFWSWFLSSLAVLAIINASGAFGKLTTADVVMPWSGTILFFVIVQVVLLVLAFRLRRHVQSASFSLPARVHNWGLATVLVLVGIACWQGWGPGYAGAGKDSNTPASVVSVPGSPPETAPPSDDGAALQIAGPISVPGAEVEKVVASAGGGSKRSWVWSFLGEGFVGWFYRMEFILIGLPLIYTLLRNSANWTARTRKNIVICLDGTSNTPDQLERGFAAQTNVYKLFKMLEVDEKGGYVPTDHFDASFCKKYKDKQIGFYYAGVGNKYDNDPIFGMLGMATGLGASEIIERAYLDLVRVYQPGDRVFIVGFSRGAAIARLLARTIDQRGAPRAVWTLGLFGKHRTLWSSAVKERVPINVLGCWDTVGSFGVAKTIAGINFQQLNVFRDLTVPDNVLQAYHMVALDEQRQEFEPTLMDPDPIRPERIVEVWFAGDHANIGGGWATDSLSDVTLDFLLARTSSGYAVDPDPKTAREKAGADQSWGLYLSAYMTDKADLADRQEMDPHAVDPDPLGQVRLWFSNLYTYRPRTLPLHAVISEAVFVRMTNSLPVYAPQALFNLNDDLDEKRDLIDKKVAKLGETNSLNETERSRVLSYKDKMQLRRWPEYWKEIMAQRGGRFDLPSAALDNSVLSNSPANAKQLECQPGSGTAATEANATKIIPAT